MGCRRHPLRQQQHHSRSGRLFVSPPCRCSLSLSPVKAKQPSAVARGYGGSGSSGAGASVATAVGRAVDSGASFHLQSGSIYSGVPNHDAPNETSTANNNKQVLQMSADANDSRDSSTLRKKTKDESEEAPAAVGEAASSNQKSDALERIERARSLK